MGTRKRFYFHLAMDCTGLEEIQIADHDACQPVWGNSSQFVIMLQAIGTIAAIEKGIKWMSHGAHGSVTLRNTSDHCDAARKTLHAWPLLSMA